MPRRLRVSSEGYAYHVLNRGVRRMRLFGKPRDFEPFEEVIRQAKARLPMRANMVPEAQSWRWSSLWHRVHGNKQGLVDDGPLALPRPWLQRVQTPQTEAELEALRRSVVRGSPFGEASWQERTAKRLGLQSTLRPCGRPWRKQPE